MRDGPAGRGWDWLVQEARDARFTLIGEEHGVAETAQFSAALFNALRESGYSRMAIELSPIMAQDIEAYLQRRMPAWREQYRGVEEMKVAVMGCVVNGPGESKAANIGISLPGTGEAPNCPVYIDGQHATTLRGTYEELAVAFRELVDNYVETKYARKADAATA